MKVFKITINTITITDWRALDVCVKRCTRGNRGSAQPILKKAAISAKFFPLKKQSEVR